MQVSTFTPLRAMEVNDLTFHTIVQFGFDADSSVASRNNCSEQFYFGFEPEHTEAVAAMLREAADKLTVIAMRRSNARAEQAADQPL